MRTPISVAIMTLAVAIASANAGTKAGVTMPDSVTVGGKRLVLNGMGLREATVLKVDVYVAALYVEHPSSDAAQILGTPQTKVIVLRFVRHVGHDDIVKAWRDGFRANATVPIERIQPQIAQLEAWTPSFQRGDNIAFTAVPGQGVYVDINGVRKGVLRGDDFARSLFAIWLGNRPPTAAVKKGLLGNRA